MLIFLWQSSSVVIHDQELFHSLILALIGRTAVISTSEISELSCNAPAAVKYASFHSVSDDIRWCKIEEPAEGTAASKSTVKKKDLAAKHVRNLVNEHCSISRRWRTGTSKSSCISLIFVDSSHCQWLWIDVTESMVTMRWPFCGYNMRWVKWRRSIVSFK